MLIYMDSTPKQQAQAVSGKTEAYFNRARCPSTFSLMLIGLATALLCLPFIRTVYWLGDEGVLLHGAELILQNKRLYVDFFEFLPPGGFVITAAWFDLVGTSFLSARCLAISVIVGIACFTYLSCRQASRNAALSAILTICWIVMSQGVWTQVSHHWFTTLFSMVAAWSALTNVEHPRRWLGWPVIAGTAAGMASIVTPTRGALVMLAALPSFLNLRRYRAEPIAYLLAGVVVPVSLLAYVVWQHALIAAFDDVIRFTSERYWSIQGVPFGSFADGQNFLLTYLFPLAAVLALLVCRSDWRTCLGDRVLWVCLTFGLAGFVGCFPRPDTPHIAFAAPLIFPFLAYCTTRLTRIWRPTYRRTLFALMIVVSLPSTFAFSRLSYKALSGQVTSTPRGGVTPIGQPGAPELLARIAITSSEDEYFFYPYMPLLPFLANRVQVSKYDLFTPGYTIPSQYRDACISVMKHAVWVVIDRRWTDPATLRLLFPAMKDAHPKETEQFEQALNRGFGLVAQDGAFEFRRRTGQGDQSACADITG